MNELQIRTELASIGLELDKISEALKQAQGIRTDARDTTMNKLELHSLDNTVKELDSRKEQLESRYADLTTQLKAYNTSTCN
jgi:predicted  nucleic acid-binding Zn-ribbon protein